MRWFIVFSTIIAGVSSCIPDYHQCVGLTYHGEVKCCTSSARCTLINDYWWQCNPCDTARKSVTDPANFDNVNGFIEGVKVLKQNGIYDNFTRQHGASQTFFQFHKNALFLPWHRWFVSQLEDAIRRDNPCFAMPYWDWSADAADPLGSAMWSLIGEANTHGGCLQTGPFVDFRGALDGECIRRDANVSHAHLFTVDELATLVSVNQSFLNFSHILENTAHAMPHLLVAHQMSSMPSPDDPLFYFHHAFTDIVLVSYLRCHPDESSRDLNDLVLPYTPGMTVADAMNIDSSSDYDHDRLCL